MSYGLNIEMHKQVITVSYDTILFIIPHVVIVWSDLSSICFFLCRLK